MKAILDERQAKHDPRNFMANGVVSRSPEQPARIGVLKAGAEAAGYVFEAPSESGLGPIAAIHSAEYLSFLQTIHARWSRIEGASSEVIPNVHPANRTDSYPQSAIGQAGFHQADTACPIGAHTWESAYWSAQTAITGADLVAGGDNGVYALCRPPGHHAFTDLAGGFCFLSNSAIAAQRLRAAGLRPAILDVDVHHGNGTQGVFYRRSDVLTVSIHADPVRFYPFYWGHAHERGEGDGVGANLNVPLPRGAGDDVYMGALDTGLDRSASFGADVIVVALGLDASIDDPFKGLAVTVDGFRRIGVRIAEASVPVLLVQEGGYLSDGLGKNLTSFLEGLQST